MKKRMFSRFTNILQNAVDALAPQLSLQEEFVHHWKAVTSYFIGNKGEKLPVEQTSIPAHLEQMLVIIQDEEAASENGMYGPCLEYLVQHKLLETLYSLARTDYPPGMKQIVLSFFTKLLSRIKQPLLPHINVHKAVHRLVKTCGEVKAAPTEIEEIQFLCTVCAKVKADPYLVNFFLEVPKPNTQINKNQGDTQPVSQARILPEFSLVSTLLNLSHSADSRVAVKACEGLILCASLPETPAAHCLVLNTDFCKNFTQRLVDTYKKLPDIVNPVDLEHVQAKWGMEVITEREDKQTFLGKRHLISFLSWLDYCDQLISIANPIVAEALSESIHSNFLIPCFQPSLLQVSETGVISATAYLTRCLRTVCSQHLLKEFVYFILGEGKTTEVSGDGTDNIRSRLIERCNHVSEEVCLVTLQLFDTLLLKEEPHIFSNLVLRNLETRGYYDYGRQEPVQSPVFSYPSTTDTDSVPTTQHRLNPESSACDSVQSCDSGEYEKGDNSTSVKEEVASYTGDGKEMACNDKIDCTHSSDLPAKLDENISDSLEGNCELKPTQDQCDEENTDVTEIKTSSESNTQPSEADEGKVQSGQVKVASNNSSTVSVPPCDKTVNRSSASSGTLSLGDWTPISSPSRTEVHKIVNSFLSLLPEELKSSYQTVDSGYDMYLKDAHKQFASVQAVCRKWGYQKRPRDEQNCESLTVFYEGAFLKMLLDKLSHMLDQSYAINLQLTSVVSKLALIQHPHLHEFLLDPYLPVKSGIRNLFTVFQKVSNEIKARLEAQPDLSKQLIQVRRQLMGVTPNIDRLRLDVWLNTGMEGQSQLEAIIVLEEFCKELSAIAFVKHHAAVTDDR